MKKSGFIALVLSIVICFLSVCAAGCSGTVKLDKPYGLSIDDSNTLSWIAVDGARSYIVSITNIDGETWENTARRSNYALSALAVGNYDIKVKAVGDGKNLGNSVWSETYYFRREDETGCLYKLINNDSEYEVSGIGSVEKEIVIDGSYRGKSVTSIGDSAFRGRKTIEKIVLSGNVRRIGESAFYNCLSLSEVVLPDTVSYIGRSAFQSCLSLESINVPGELTSISESTFAYCRSLTKIDLTGIEEIGPSAFSSCDMISELVLPGSLASLDERAFSQARGLKSVTFNPGLARLGDKAFAGCTALEELNFTQDGSLKEIGDYTFTECYSLTEVVLPKGLQTIGFKSFAGAKNLTNVVIPSSITRVGGNAFDDTKIYNDSIARGDAFVYVDNWLVQIARGDEASDCPNVRMTKIIAETDGGNERIPDGDWYNCKFKPGVVGIADYAFSYCYKLNTAEIPLSVKYIGDFAFSNCDNFYRLKTLSGLKRIGVRAFSNCTLLKVLELDKGLEIIGREAFRGCTSLVNYKDKNMIPESVTQIEPDAFYETGLWDKEDDYGVVYAGNWIVGYKNWGSNYDLVIGNPYYPESTDDASVNIADYAFFNKNYYYYMLYLLQPELFEDSESKPLLPLGGISKIEGLYNVRIMGEGAFYGCNYLQSAFVGDNVKEIRDYTFYGCEGLKEVNIPYMLESIGTSAFYNCKNLRNVVNEAIKAVFPEFDGLNLYGCRVTDIGDYAFYGTAIKGVILGNRMENIGEVAFYNCHELETVELPDTVKRIKYATFTYCDALKSIKLGENIHSIDAYAFYGCNALTKLKVPDSVKTIGDYAFFDSGLETIDFGNGLEKIGAYAFASSKLQALTLPSGIKSVGEYAFRDCEELLSVNIPYSLQQIGVHTFYGCEKMTAYMQNESKPDGWSLMWNSSYRPEVWGCEMSDDGLYVVSVTVGEGSINNAFSIEAYQVTVSAPYRTDYYFGGWTTKEDSNEAEYSADKITKVPAGTKLYAVWAQ